jgi:polygalacturonase
VDFGAKADNSTMNTIFIQRAIDNCSEKGGGTIYIPTGVFITGSLILKSNINLHLEAGAVLKGSPHIEDYTPYQSPIHASPSTYGIIYAYKANNVSITGQGAIDGNEKAFFIWNSAKKIEWGGTSFTRQKENYRKVDTGIGDGPVVPKADRPRQMIIFSGCTNVLIKDVQLIKSPFWTLHFADCDGVIASALKIWTSLETPNSDGIDITSCKNVIISNCDIRTGDDAIAITGYANHFELPGFQNLKHLSENITITNCNLQSRSSGIRIGFLDQNSVRNIHISNINITNSNRGIGIFVRDEGSIENISISQVFIETRLHTGDWWGNGEPIHVSAVPGTANNKLGKIKNLTFRDIFCNGDNGILMYGSDESQIENIQFHNLHFTFRKGNSNEVAGGNIDLRGALGNNQLFAFDISAIYAQHITNLTLNQIKINWENVTESYFKHGIHIKDFNDVIFTNVDCQPSPSNTHLPAILLENGKGFTSEKKYRNIKKINVSK